MIWSKPLLYYLLGQSSLSTNVSRLYPREELQNVSMQISIPEFALPEVNLLRHKTDNKQSTPDVSIFYGTYRSLLGSKYCDFPTLHVSKLIL